MFSKNDNDSSGFNSLSDSDNKVTNEISDCLGIAIASVVKECRPTHQQKHTSLERVVFLYQLFMYVFKLYWDMKYLI